MIGKSHGAGYRRRSSGTAAFLLFARIFPLLVTMAAFPQRIPSSIEYVSPLPGSTLNSPQVNIIVRVNPSSDRGMATELPVFLVRGAISGEHSGATTLSDDGKTFVFTPDQPFAQDELVKVDVRMGPAHGGQVYEREFNFQVSPRSIAEQSEMLDHFRAGSLPNGVQGGFLNAKKHDSSAKIQRDTLPTDFPTRAIVVSDNPEPGNLFLASFKIAEASDHLYFVSYVPSDNQYLMILDKAAKPDYFRKMPAMSTDFKVQPNGFLSYYDDKREAYFELDSNYVVIDSFRCGNGYRTNLHELVLLPNGHALMLGDDPQSVDMGAIVVGGNPMATVIGAVVQELDRDKNVIFQWRSFDHFKITDAVHEDLTSATIDYVHPNTIEVDTDGNLLLSSRHMDEITKIDRHTGNIIWRWGGKNNQFTFIDDTLRFSHQHTIRRTPTRTLILFDNGNYRSMPSSRAVEYQLDENAKTAKLIWQFRHSPDIKSIAMGSVQRLADGMTVIGWGSASPAVTEVRPNGSIALEIGLPDSLVSYRALFFPWKQTVVATAVRQDKSVPLTPSLQQNYPNPFNPTTRIQFSLPQRTRMSLKVYDLLGRTVATLVEGEKPAGSFSVRFDGTRLASGTYVYRLATSDRSISRTMTLLK